MAYQMRGKLYEDFELGAEYETMSRTVTEADVVLFAGLAGDFNPLHTDEEYAKKYTPFGTRIAHGALILAIATGMANQMGWFEGTTVAVVEFVTRFTRPVRFGDTIRLKLIVRDKRESEKADRGVIVFGVNVLNQRDETVLEGTWTIILRRRAQQNQ